MTKVLTEEQKKMVIANRRYARAMGTNVINQYGLHHLYDDMVSASYEGLVEAVQNYNPERNVSFQSYAYYRIKGEVLDQVQGYTPHRRFIYNSLKNNIFDGTTNQLRRKRGNFLNFEEEFLLQDRDFSGIELREFLDRTSKKLSETQKFIIKEYYGNDMSFSEIADQLGYSKSYVAKIHSNAIKKLKKMAVKQ